MELVVLAPMVLVLSGIAVFTALRGRCVPSLGAASLASTGPVQQKPAAPRLVSPRAVEVITPLSRREALPAGVHPQEEIAPMNEQRFSTTDVLLADALTEMIGLKAELYHLRSRVESLNHEVARLAADPQPPTPPAASRRPIPLRRAA